MSDGSDTTGNITITDPATASDGNHLREVTAARDNLTAAEQRLTSAIAAARRAGDSWTKIGLILGVTKQAAHRKYAPKIDEP